MKKNLFQMLAETQTEEELKNLNHQVLAEIVAQTLYYVRRLKIAQSVAIFIALDFLSNLN